jgi:hypothetical protein
MRCHIRAARAGDVDAVAGLAAELAQSFLFSPEQFRPSQLEDPPR